MKKFFIVFLFVGVVFGCFGQSVPLPVSPTTTVPALLPAAPTMLPAAPTDSPVAPALLPAAPSAAVSTVSSPVAPEISTKPAGKKPAPPTVGNTGKKTIAVSFGFLPVVNNGTSSLLPSTIQVFIRHYPDGKTSGKWVDIVNGEDPLSTEKEFSVALIPGDLYSIGSFYVDADGNDVWLTSLKNAFYSGNRVSPVEINKFTRDRAKALQLYFSPDKDGNILEWIVSE